MLRRFKVVPALRGAFVRACEKDSFRICHFSIQRHHIHLVCEADGAEALARGIQGFAISAARRLNRRVVAPTSWLLTTGWRRHGLLHPTEVPASGRSR